MKKFFLLFCVVTILLLSPSQGSAYFTTAQDAVAIGKTSAIFKIEYSFGAGKEDFYMPIFAKRNLENGAETSQAGYELLEDSKHRVDTGNMASIILSDAEIDGQFYRIPARTKATFTMYVFFHVPDTLLENDYALRVTEMPFYVGDTRAYRKLNPSELQYYISPEVELNGSE